ncbi:MAG: hypothetical protein GY854_04150 [Deltaproteobacteria bacterium]|nr:hypothetical protein [Deltaproteobacteria bacterium]
MGESFKNIGVFHTQIKMLRIFSYIAILMTPVISIATVVDDGNWLMFLSVPVAILFRKYVCRIWGDVYDVVVDEDDIYIFELREKIALSRVVSITHKMGLGMLMAELKLNFSIESIKFVCTPDDYNILLSWLDKARRRTLQPQ